MTRLTIIGLSVLLAACLAASTAQAHSAKVAGIPAPHKLWDAIKDKWFDPPPGAPKGECRWAIRNEEQEVYDPKLGAYVVWQCFCENEVNCHWRRLRIVQDSMWPFWGGQPKKLWYREWHRACASIVCKRVRVSHWYPFYNNDTGLLW